LTDLHLPSIFRAEPGGRSVPRIESAKKAMRQGRARHERNRALDRAARKGLIHANNAARHKSRLAAVVGKLKK
jgi:ribosomal protein S20